MIPKAKRERHLQIAQSAYAVLSEKGYEGLSMLAVAKHARASNETLYRWYGDKRGLFRALIETNAEEVQTFLQAALTDQTDPDHMLKLLGPKLLRLLLSDRAIALNRAAAADPSGDLGKVLTQAGRASVFPFISTIFSQLHLSGRSSLDPDKAAALYLDLLVGDQQIRRAIGMLEEPDRKTCENRSEQALKHLFQIIGPT